MAALPILLVEDSEPDARLIVEALREADGTDGETVHRARTMREAIEAIEATEYACILLDLGLPDAKGVENVERIRNATSAPAIVVMTGLDDERTALEALRRGAQEYLVKGNMNEDQLLRTIRHAVQRNQLLNELDAQRERDYFQATHDMLTGLPNRQMLNDRVQQAIAQSERHRERFAYCFVDLDGFKGVNDTFGHALGDALLRRIADLIRRTVRDSDTAARVGGDEFVLLLHPIHSNDEVERIIGRISAAIDELDEIDGDSVDVGASVGVAMYPDDGCTEQDLSQFADRSMYREKRERKRDQGRQSLPPRSESPIDAGPAELTYMPVLDAEDWRIVGAHALRRPHAVTDAMVTDFETYLDSALAAISDWRRRPNPPERIRLDVSADEVRQADFTQRLIHAIERLEIPTSCLTLGLPEEECSAEPDLLVNLSLLRSHQVRTLVTHFGRNEASMARISRLPVDGLVLDPALVRSAQNRAPTGRAVAQGIVRYAQALDLTIHADQLKSREDVEAAIEIGCHRLEGPAFGGPQRASVPPALLKLDESAFPVRRAATSPTRSDG